MQNDDFSDIQIKGIRDGLLVTMGEGTWNDLLKNLKNQIDHKPGFFKGAMLVIDIGFRVLQPQDIAELQQLLISRGMGISSFVSESPTTQNAVKSLGLASSEGMTKKTQDLAPLNTQLDGESALFVRKNLRSGNKIHYPGHVMVIGDVNPGAEILAGGNVMVWGKAKGFIHAGAEGDVGAAVYMMWFERATIQVAGKNGLTYAKKWKNGPSMARIEDGQLIIKNWDPKTS